MHLSLKETAAQAGISFETARRWAHAGLGYQVGGRWRVDPIKLDRKLHGLPLNPIPNKKLAALLRRAADVIEGGGNEFTKPLALVIGEIMAWGRAKEILEAGGNNAAPDRETANAGTGGAAS